MPALIDNYLDNGGYGGADAMFREHGGSYQAYRPFLDRKGRPCVTLPVGMKYNAKSGKDEMVYETMHVRDAQWRGIDNPVMNATTLRKLEWQHFDEVILRETRQRLRAWSDLAGANTFRLDGMSRTILEYETMSDPGEAVVDMDGLGEGRQDVPRFQLEGLPLPITHCDFFFSERDLRLSRNTGTPLDTTMAEAAARRVAEKIEDTVIGLSTGMSIQMTNSAAPAYGRTMDIYGLTDFTARNTYTTLTAPTGSNPNTTVDEVLAMIDVLKADGFYGPYMIYHSNDWDRYMDADYAFVNSTGWAVNPTMTLRDRLLRIEDVRGCRRLDRWTPASGTFELLIVQMTQDVARAVIGMPIMTVQWPSIGGLRRNFKVMGIMVPQVRATFSGDCGILHATTA